MALTGCQTAGGKGIDAPPPADLKPADYATIPSVINRLKCDVLGELAKNAAGSAWHPKSVDGTVVLSVVQAADVDAQLGFAIPVASVATLDFSGEKEQVRSNTRKFTLTFRFDENPPLDPAACANNSTKVQLVDHEGRKTTIPTTPLVDFVDLGPMMESVANISPKIAVKEVVYEGAFEIVKKTTVKGDVNFVIVKLGSASRLRSSDYTQSYKMDVTYSTDGAGTHWYDATHIGPPIAWPSPTPSSPAPPPKKP